MLAGFVVEKGDIVLGAHGLRRLQGVGGRLVVGARRGRSHAVRFALLGGGLGPFQQALHLDGVLLAFQGAVVGIWILVVIVDQVGQGRLQVWL